MSSLIIYTSDDGQTRINLRVVGDRIWLSQLEIAKLSQNSAVKDSLTAQIEGHRQVHFLQP